MVTLSSYGCTFECGVGAWGLQNEINKLGKLELVDKKVHEAHPPLEFKVWDNKDIVLDMPNSKPLEEEVEVTNAYVLHYDGGCTKKKGSGGFVVWDPNGRCVVVVVVVVVVDA